MKLHSDILKRIGTLTQAPSGPREDVGSTFGVSCSQL